MNLRRYCPGGSRNTVLKSCVLASARPTDTTHDFINLILPFQLSAKLPVTATVFPPPFHWIGTLTNPSSASTFSLLTLEGGVGAIDVGGGSVPVCAALSLFLTGLPSINLPGILIGTTGFAGRCEGEESEMSLGYYGLIAPSAARVGETDALGMLTGAVRGAGTDPSILLIAPNALEPANGDATRPPNA